jgi:aldehyde:ferredoxin oxidoreductase
LHHFVDQRGAHGCALTLVVNPWGAYHRRAWPPLEPWSGKDSNTVDGKAAMIKVIYDDQIVKLVLLVCDFLASAIQLTMEDYAAYLDAATGWGMDVATLRTAAERTEILIRLINNREGFRRKDDVLPALPQSRPASSPA